MKSKLFVVLGLISTAASAAVQTPSPTPTPAPTTTITDSAAFACGPYEIWTKTAVTTMPDGLRNSELKRVWMRTAVTQKEFDLKEASAFQLANKSETLSCEISSWQTGPLNNEGDVLSVVSTCGQFVPFVMMPTFMSERIYYVFNRRGEVLKKGLCHRP